MNSLETFTIEPMSAGDIIDRAVRLYKRNFLVLLRIVLAPSLVAYTGWILLEIGVRNISFDRGDSRLVLMVLLICIGGLLYLVGKVAFYVVLGGASRSLVYHFFDGTPLRARDVYQSVREKVWSLIGAMCLIGFLVAGIGLALLYIVAILMMIYGAVLGLLIANFPYWIQVVFNSIFGILLVVVVVGVMLMIYSRMVYVPQVLMVEGRNVYEAIGRSFRLAKGGVLRIAMLILFWIYVAWSLWILLMIPLGWYAYWTGVDINPFSAQEPLWYSIAQQTLTQLSEILIAPIVMLGFTLLYIDSKVRKEGFDIELLANRLLSPPSDMPQIQPGFSSQDKFQLESTSWVPSILGLNNYNQSPVNPAVTIPTSLGSASTGFDRSEGGNEFLPPGIIRIDVAKVDLPVKDEPKDLSKDLVDMTAITPSMRGSVITVQLDAAQRACRWCGTEASVGDRFCRVCGAVF